MSIDPTHIVQAGGILLVAAIVFAESGLLIGFFLPGDSLLFTAGLFASQGEISIFWLIVAIVIAAIIGDNVGYAIGRKTGHKIFTKKDGILFRQEYISQAEVFYEKHGGKTITIARFVPVVRTFAPVVAGVAKMNHKKFMAYNVVGALVWGVSVTMVGYVAGTRFPWIENYIEVILISAILLTFTPPIIHVLKDPISRKKLSAWFKNKFKKNIHDSSLVDKK